MKRVFFSLLLLSLVSFLLNRCDEPEDDTEPVVPVVHSYNAYAVNSEVLVGETDTIKYASNADSAVITAPSGPFQVENPVEGSFLFSLEEEGSYNVDIDFFWNDSLLPFNANKQCAIKCYLPLEVTAPTDSVPWRSGGRFHLETHLADSSVISYSGFDTVLTGNFPRYFTTRPLDENTQVNITAYNKLGVVKDSVVVLVSDPTRADTISNKCGPPWTYSGLAFSPDGVNWNIVELRDCDVDNTQEFCLNPEQKAYMRFGEIRCDTEQDVVNPWHLSSNGEFLFIGESELWPFRITKLTIDTLEYTYHYSGFDITRETWTR